MSLHYLIRIFLEGLDDCLIYEVNKAEYDRIRRNIDGSIKYFCSFETLNGLSVAFNLQCIELVNFLWQIGNSAKDVEGEQEEGYDILIRFKSRKEPYICDTYDAKGVYNLLFRLETGFFEDEYFESFIDADDEEVVIDMRKVLYIEASSELVMEGSEMTKEELGITENTEEKSMKPRKAPKNSNKKKK